jgi:hypothetical protein
LEPGLFQAIGAPTVPTDLDGLANIAGKYHLRSGYLNNRKQLGQAGISNLLAEEILNPEKLGILAAIP